MDARVLRIGCVGKACGEGHEPCGRTMHAVVCRRTRASARRRDRLQEEPWWRTSDECREDDLVGVRLGVGD